MKLFAVFGGWDYEGSTLIGIFDNVEGAQQLQERVLLGPSPSAPDKHYFDYTNIEILELNEIEEGAECYLRDK